MRLDFRAAALAASSFAREHQYPIVARVDEALRHHSVVVQDLRDRAEVFLDAFISVVRLGQVGKLARPVPFDLRVDQRPKWLRRYANRANGARHTHVEGRIYPAHNLDVLLRHALLHETDGFESLGFAPVFPDFADFSVAK